MNTSRIGKEIYFASHLVTIIMITIFTGVLILLNVMHGWEKWMIPVIFAGLAVCLAVHISGKGSPRLRMYFYAAFLIFESFYYTVNITTVYDSTALSVIIVFIFAMSGERLLVTLGTLSSLGGMVLHLFLAEAQGGLKLVPSNIVRTVWQFVLIVLSAILADRLSSAWFSTEKQYQKRIDEVVEENERANNFLANVSHEIRTPVNAVMGLASIMEKEEMPDQLRHNMSAIAEAGHRVADQIGDIMDYTEIDMKKLSVSSERYMINSVVNDLITQLRFMEDYGLDLVIDLSPEVPSELIGDDTKIKKILRHLITNGFKFTRTGGVNVHIYAKKRDYGVNLILEVTDTGVGMSGTEIEHIYEKFYQADSGRSRSAGGLGLGIPIVNGLARAMGGFLHIESEPGHGTVVRVSIPQMISDGSPCISVGNKDSIIAAGFLSFLTTSEPRIKDFHLEMVAHLVKGLGINFHRVRTRDELERLVREYSITHLFVGTGEYLENRSYIDGLSENMNVVLVEDRDFEGTAGSKIALMKKPFYGTQVANFLNLSYVSGSAAENEKMTCPGVKALVVDDEPMNLLVARGIFETYGMEVTTVPGGAEAVEICSVQDFDIIFMDHMMPGMDGVETMKRLRLNASKLGVELTIVALTANVISSAKEMFLAEGFNAFLPKPIELMELERVLRHVLPRQAIVCEPAKSPEKPAETAETQTGAPAEETAPAEAETSLPAGEQTQTEQTEQPEKPDLMTALKNAGVDTAEGLGYCQDDEDFYREILGEYARDSAGKLAEIQGYWSERDWKNYAIKVHSVKSTSKTIGADALSEKARQLEMSAKAGGADITDEAHARLIEEYGRLMELINSFAGAGESAPGNAGAEETGGSDGDDEIMEFSPGGGV